LSEVLDFQTLTQIDKNWHITWEKHTTTSLGVNRRQIVQTSNGNKSLWD